MVVLFVDGVCMRLLVWDDFRHVPHGLMTHGLLSLGLRTIAVRAIDGTCWNTFWQIHVNPLYPLDVDLGRQKSKLSDRRVKTARVGRPKMGGI